MAVKQVEDLIWKSSKSVRWQRLMLLGIRFVEICMASLVPSLIGLWLVFLNPTPRILSVMSFLSYVAFVVVNWNFWMKFKKQRTQRKEYFIINGLAYTLYAGISLAIFEFSGEFLYSIVFSNLRGLEPFGLHTGYSLVTCHAIMYALMIICEIYSRSHYRKLLEKLAENGADEIEMDPWGNLKPMQKDAEVNILSVDEVHEQMAKDQSEAAQVLMKIGEEEVDSLWDSAMYKGRGEAVALKEFDMPEVDIESGDYVAGGDPESMEGYSTEALWNAEIYKGRTEGDAPIENYDDEPDELPDFFTINNYEGSENEPLWSPQMYKGRDKTAVVEDGLVVDDDITPHFDDYDEDTLWSIEMYKGRGDEIERPDREKEDKRDFIVLPTENSKYDADALWDEEFYKSIQGRQAPREDEVARAREQSQYTMDDYDSDHLWDSVKQGK